jgi:hypothetical protein
MFNNQGEVNAVSVRDALNTIVRYASIIENNVPSNYALAGTPSVTDAQTDEMIARAIFTQDGKISLAQTMANPIR